MSPKVKTDARKNCTHALTFACMFLCGGVLASAEEGMPPQAGTSALAESASAFEPSAAVFDDHECAASPLDLVPNMIGESVGVGYHVYLPNDVFSTPDFQMSRVQIAMNNSPLPRDRIFFTYDVGGGAFQRTNQSWQRNTVGFEKTLFCNWLSADVRIPFLTQPAFAQTTGTNGQQNTRSIETHYGDVMINLKGVMLRTEQAVLSGGLGIRTPTGPGRSFTTPNGAQWRLLNDTTSIHPFLAAATAPDERRFAQAFLGVDLPAGQNSVTYSRPTTGMFPAVNQTTEIYEQSILHFDVGAGYWIYQNNHRRWLTGIAPTVEVHYSTTLTGADFLSVGDPFLTAGGGAGIAAIGNPNNRMNGWIVTLGTTMRLHRRSTLALGAGIPLGSIANNQQTYDWSLFVQLNQVFGAW